MVAVTLDHFRRAAIDIGSHGDNDTLPFDIDNRFVKDKNEELAGIAFNFFKRIDKFSRVAAKKAINELPLFSERLLVPTGPAGFRVTTKIHPFWNVYFNGLGVAIAENNEPNRSDHAHSYRYVPHGEELFDRKRSWRSYREATLSDPKLSEENAVVVQTDISSFYEHIYHHRIENCVNDLFENNSTVGTQVDALLSNFASGRSFGLPVGGQGARILAELLMSSIDQLLTDAGLIWHRYVDDFVVITSSQEAAYKALSVISHALADYGLSLNRTKTTILKAKHYADYVSTQLGVTDQESQALREIDLHFDPYSDSAVGDYSDLKESVQKLDVQSLLNLELKKAQPETFLVAQISRTLKFHSPLIAIQLCGTLLNATNLHAFRASWSTIMRGVAAVRSDEKNKEIFDELDGWLDEIPESSSHLLQAESSCLHYLRTIRFRKTEVRARYVLETYNSASSEAVKRACVECWHLWNDRPSIISQRNKWNVMGANLQRMLWVAFYGFGDEGKHARNQVKASTVRSWSLGIEEGDGLTFCDLYLTWSANGK